MAEESRQLYLTKDPTLNRILQSISDRIDKLEGLRSNPKFYKKTFEFGETLSSGQVLTASASDSASFDAATQNFGDVSGGNYFSISSDGDISIYRGGQLIHYMGA